MACFVIEVVGSFATGLWSSFSDIDINSRFSSFSRGYVRLHDHLNGGLKTYTLFLMVFSIVKNLTTLNLG
jgi:DNA polymerase sigma